MVTNRNTRYTRYERKTYNVRKTKHKHQLVVHGIVIILIMVIGLKMHLVQTKDGTKREVVNGNVSTTSKVVQMTIPAIPITPKQMVHEQESQQEQKEEMEMCPKFEYSKVWSTDDDYLLARIVMAEAEGCNMQTKTLVAMVVLNRVWSEQFPDTIHDVIFEQCANGTYQFSSIGNGRWDRVEPNGDCYEAIEIVKQSVCDYSGGALYFENCTDEDNWHSRNLEYIYESDGIRFYK